MSIARRAVKESKAVADLAVAAAEKQLIEKLTPGIKSLVDAALRAGTLDESIDRLRRAADGHGETEFEEGKKMDDDEKLESVAALFPNVSEMADDDTVDEAADDMDEAVTEDSAVEEELEISESELEEMYAEALQLEVDVSKGFKDMEKPHEFGAGLKGQYQSDGANLMDYKNGESEWDNVEPPAKQDFTVKEQKIRALVRKGLAENKQLAEQNAALRETVIKVSKKLKEMNLLNSKILHVNKFITRHRLNTEQKKAVIESIDRGTSVKEVRSIYGIIESSFKAAGAVTESTVRKARGDSQKKRTSGGADPKVLRESADRNESNGYDRMLQLAGLKKATNG